MPESPLRLVYAVRAFAASVASIIRPISWIFCRTGAAECSQENRPVLLLKYRLKVAANSSERAVPTWFAAPMSISPPATPKENNKETAFVIRKSHLLNDKDGKYPAELNNWERTFETESARIGFTF